MVLSITIQAAAKLSMAVGPSGRLFKLVSFVQRVGCIQALSAGKENRQGPEFDGRRVGKCYMESVL